MKTPLGLFVLSLLLSLPVAAQSLYAGNTIAYEGHLEQNGSPIDEPVTMTFHFYASVDATTELDSFTTTVTPRAGDFALDLGPLDDAVFASDELYIAITVNGALLSERRKVVATPRAARADTSGNLTVTGTAFVVGNTVSNRAEIGDMGHGPTFAGLAHESVATSSSYGFLQQNDGTTFVNTSPTGSIRLRANNVDKVVMDQDGNLDISGQARVGYRHKTCAYPDGADFGDCTCDLPGERVVSGGTYTLGATNVGGVNTAYAIRENRPLNETTWRAACIGIVSVGFTTSSVRTNCEEINIICARVGD